MQPMCGVKVIVLALAFTCLSACTDSEKNSAMQKPGQSTLSTSSRNPGGVSSDSGTGSDPNIFVNLAKKIVPSVVNISTSKAIKSPYIQGGPDDVYRKFFENFFGPGWGGAPFQPHTRHHQDEEDTSKLPHAMSLGTGFVIDADGLILTNNHVVADADEIKIKFSEDRDEKPSEGEVVGRDSELDVALIRVKGKKNLIPLSLGDSDSLQVGEYVVAVGNPFGQGHSVTHGIISAKERSVPGLGDGLSKYLQTDAPINPGNSGGPLVNLKGEVVGINNAILANAQGIGFAIPASAVKKVLAQLEKRGKVERGYIGAMIGDLSPDLAEKLGVSPDLKAPFVTSVASGAPADEAGIKPYDVILSVNGKKVSSASDLVSSIMALSVGDTASLLVSREGKEKNYSLKVVARPDSTQAKLKFKTMKPSRTDLGMGVETLTPDLAEKFGMDSKTKGLVVTRIEGGGPAERAGLSQGDVILEVDRKKVDDPDDFYGRLKSGKSYLLRVLKNTPDRDTYQVIILDLLNE